MKTIGCVGSRNLDGEQLDVCYRVGYELGRNKYKVASGNAEGADYTFAKAASKHDPKLVTLYVPRAGHRAACVYDGNNVVDINDDPKYQLYLEIAAKCHPYWQNINKTYTKNLFARNVAIVANSAVIIAHPNATKWSGTLHTIAVAKHLGKSVYLIKDNKVLNAVNSNYDVTIDEFLALIKEGL